MKIEVTDLTTNEKTTYDLSKDNWRKAWACMLGGLVHMWVPYKMTICEGSSCITSGRRWTIKR